MYVKVDADGKVSYNNAGEKLHQKKHWRHHRMIFDFWQYFEDKPDVRQVHFVTGSFACERLIMCTCERLCMYVNGCTCE